MAPPPLPPAPASLGVDAPGDAAADAQLMAAVAAKDPRAQRRLVERLGARVRRLTGLLCGRRADADDAAQQSMLEILCSAGNFREPHNLGAWADRITARTTRGTQRLEQLRRGQLLRWLSPGMLPWGHTAAAAPGERLGADALLAELPAERRHVLVLHHALGYKVEENCRVDRSPGWDGQRSTGGCAQAVASVIRP